MMALLDLYWVVIISGMIASAALALLGCHLAARDKGMETLCVGQGATLGVLVGLGILQSLGVPHIEGYFDLGPFSVAILFSILTFVAGERLIRGKDASKSTLFLAFFAVLLATSYLTSFLFPQLESHMTQVFFGDIATLSNAHAELTAALSVLALFFLVKRWRTLSNESFELAIFGSLKPVPENAFERWLFPCLALGVLCYSVQFLGYLFTIACLFLPTALLRFLRQRHLRQHYIAAALLAISATAAGFVLSLTLPRLPTVPTVVAVMLFEFGCLYLTDRLKG